MNDDLNVHESGDVQVADASVETVQAVSFDLDDTLWHCAPAIARADAALFQWFQAYTPRIVSAHTPDSILHYQAGVRQNYPELRRCVSSLRLAGLRDLLVEFGYPATMAEEAFDVFYRARSEVELYEDALDVLAGLKSRYRLAAITNGNADLDLIGIAPYFDVILAANMTSAPKPEPDMFHACLNFLELPSQALLHVGDNPVTDVLGARNAGVQSLWFNQYNDQWPDHLPLPHFQVQTLSDISALLMR